MPAQGSEGPLDEGSCLQCCFLDRTVIEGPASVYEEIRAA
jgi:hypothetical protein